MNYIVYDIEATCWEDFEGKRDQMEIIEIGAVRLNEKYEEIATAKIIIKPSLNPVLSKYCKDLTHISQEEVDKGVSFTEGLDLFLAFCGDDFRMGSWGAFDRTIIQKECERRDICSEFLERHFNLKYAFARKIGKKPRSLDKALTYLKLEFTGNKHRALDDSINTAKIAKNLELFGKIKED